MLIRHVVSLSALVLTVLSSPAAWAGQVAIYTGTTQWIAKPLADAQAQICLDKLAAGGVTETTWFQLDTDMLNLADWMTAVTDNGETDVCVLYGDLPPDIYPQGNTMPDGSIIEMFIESTDGDTVINHADYMFWGLAARNSEGGLQNIMDIPGIVMWDDNTPVVVTDQGREIAPSLTDFLSDRPFHLDQLAGNWYAEAVLAQNAAGTRADPVIVRDRRLEGENLVDLGRLVPIHQTADGNEPKGAVAAEIIFWLLGIPMEPVRLRLSGYPTNLTGKVSRIDLRLEDVTGSPRPAASPLTVNLASDSATGDFDTVRGGPFDGSVTSIVIPAGERSATFFYKETTARDVVITASAAGLEQGELTIKVLEEAPYEEGEVAIYSGTTQWIDKALADQQAEICSNKLGLAGVVNTWYSLDIEMPILAEWMVGATANGKRDVCVLYGDVPPDIYPQGNTMPDGSILENFVESTDGDTVINHADYMFWGLNARNSEGGLRNVMDLPGIVMWDDNTPMTVTEEGREVAPSLTDYMSDRPFHLDELAGSEWFPELVLAQNAAGTRADPVVVRDGNRGRLIPVFQTAFENNPKGAVAAEIIFWIYGKSFDLPAQLALRSKSAIPTGRALAVTVELQDLTGSPRAAGGPVVVNLQENRASGAFDTQAGGPFDGTVTSVTIPAGSSSVVFFYKDTAEGQATITASSGGLTAADLQVDLFTVHYAPPGQVAIYTGVTNWIDKPLADTEAQVCLNGLINAGIDATWYPNEFEAPELALWMEAVTGNGLLDVVVLYGDIPPDLYPQGNTMPDGSIVENFIESTDGDAVINHADYMFWGLNARNSEGGLRNVMDIPDIVMWDDNTPVVVTELGREIAPSLTDYMTDRPFHLDQLAGEWFEEAVLAQNAAGNRADPVIVKDGPRGRLIPAFQTAFEANPKGLVAAEIILWLLSQGTAPPPPATPTGLTTLAGDGQVSLDWNDNGEPDLIGYNLYRSIAGGAFNKVNGPALTSSSFVDSGLANGTEFCYRVSAVSPGGESQQTASACATPVGAGVRFRRGDTDSNQAIELTDAVNLLGYLFLGAGKPNCLDAADVDDNGAADISDAIANLGYQFLGGPPPVSPGPTSCGPDVDLEVPDLGCDRGC